MGEAIDLRQSQLYIGFRANGLHLSPKSAFWYNLGGPHHPVTGMQEDPGIVTTVPDRYYYWGGRGFT